MRWISRGVFLALVTACGGSDAATTDALPSAVTLSPEGARHMNESFSPDGKRVAYWSPASDSSADFRLWVANADLTAPVSLPVASPVSSQAAWSPDGARVAAVSNKYGFADVVAVTLATGEVTRMTQGPGVEIPLSWHRDGQLLSYFGTSADGAFRSYVITVATGKSTPLVPDEPRPYFGAPSPDGSHVAYFVADGSKVTIWVADSSGGNRRQLTTEGFETLVQFHEWSPDGKSLLYESRRTGTSDLWVVSIDSGAPRQLTRNVRNDYAGAWSPDGKWIAFLSDRGKQTDLWLVPSTGGEERRITNTPAEELSPSWRGPGVVTFGVSTVRNGIWAMDLADGTERRLSPDSVRVGDYWASPEGTMTNFVIERGGGVRDLAVVPIAGGPMRVLVSGDASILGPRWSPDGSQIVYDSDRAGTVDVWLVDAAGGAPRQLVAWPSAEACPVWSGDGSAVYFTSDRESRLGDVWKVAASGGEPTRITRNGNVGCLNGRAGVKSVFGMTLSPRGGQIGIERIQDAGDPQVVWEKSSAQLRSVFPSGDSVAAMVAQAAGSMRAMILAASGGGGRFILKPGEVVGNSSYDGKFLLYESTVGGAGELNLLNVGDGTTRRLTTTPEAEDGAEFTRDGKSIVFRRSRTVQRIHTVDVAKLLAPVTP